MVTNYNQEILKRQQDILRQQRGLAESKDKKYASERGKARTIARIRGLQQEIFLLRQAQTKNIPLTEAVKIAQQESFNIRRDRRRSIGRFRTGEKQREFDVRRVEYKNVTASAPLTRKNTLADEDKKRKGLGITSGDPNKQPSLFKDKGLVSSRTPYTAPKKSTKFEIIKEFLPIVNDASQRAYKKLFKFDTNLTGTELANVVFDVLTIAELGTRKKKTSSPNDSPLQTARITPKVVNFVKTKTKTTLQGLMKTITTIIVDVGYGVRAYQSSQRYYNVDNSYLDTVINNTALKDNFKNNNDLYADYMATVNNQTKFFDKKVDVEDYTKLIGLDFATKKKIDAAQSEYMKFLRDSGLSMSDAQRVVRELENKRKARLFGQVVGAVRTEYASEALAQRLLKNGVSKKLAVGTAGAREGLSVLAQEGYIQKGDINAFDIAMAVFFGASGSIYFSKQKILNLPKPKIDKATKSIAGKMVNKLSGPKKKKYIDKVITKVLKDNSIKPTPKVINGYYNKLSKKDKDKYLKEYVIKIIQKNRMAKKKRTTELKLIRDPIANIIDPFEIAGDVLFDLGEKIRRKLNIKKVKKIKRTKIKSLSKSTLAKSQPKLPGKTKPKLPGKTKPKLPGKTKPKLPGKTKPKPQTKIKPKTKPKLPGKTKPKPQTKVPTRSIPFPSLDFPKSKSAAKPYVVYQVKYNVGKKVFTKTAKLTKYRAIREASKARGTNKRIVKVGYGANKDIKAFKLANFRLEQSGNVIKLKPLKR